MLRIRIWVDLQVKSNGREIGEKIVDGIDVDGLRSGGTEVSMMRLTRRSHIPFTNTVVVEVEPRLSREEDDDRGWRE